MGITIPFEPLKLPSPHKFGLSLIQWRLLQVRICGERGIFITHFVRNILNATFLPPVLTQRHDDVAVLILCAAVCCLFAILDIKRERLIGLEYLEEIGYVAVIQSDR